MQKWLKQSIKGGDKGFDFKKKEKIIDIHPEDTVSNVAKHSNRQIISKKGATVVPQQLQA